ncbi:LCP family protein [Brevibacillus massiliensis]|jgi:LCP family protein required for cell wall assembly|uniref:LCP family protein n=1 Tax=Brevibacillus massiliensis TaxID=1118054 RepID=UPI00037593E3|nr:LCP family protein [Brevibacillus massiliensis]
MPSSSIRGKRLLGLVVLFFLLVGVGFAIYSGYHLRKMTREWYQPLPVKDQSPQKIEAVLPTDQPIQPNIAAPAVPAAPIAKPGPLKPFTLLLIGTDSRDGERARSDTMILAAVHPKKQRAYLLSIPRDSFMNLPDKGYDKVNHAMAFGGTALVKKSLENFFDLKIDRYMAIDFEGFRKLIDELGGVQVNVKKRMKYTDPTDDTYINFSPGIQTLNGKQALDYARYRRSDIGPDDGDFERILRQQELIRALAQKGNTAQAFFKSFKLMDILGKHVKTDLTEAELASLLFTYYDSRQNELEMETLKGTDGRIWRHGTLGWYYFISKKERERIRSRFAEELAR